MACNAQIPVDDIAEEVKQLLDLDQYVKQDNGTANNLTLKGDVALDSAAKASLCAALDTCIDGAITDALPPSGVVAKDNGTANNLTLKGGVTLDSATKQDLCEALANCFEDNYVVSFARNGNDLTITLDGGESYSVSLSDLATKQDIVGVNKAIDNAKQAATEQDTALFDKLSALIDALRTAVDTKQAEQDKTITGLLTDGAVNAEKLTALSEKVDDMASCLGCDEDDEYVNNALITSFDVNERAKTLEIRLADNTTFSIAGSKLAAIL